MVNSPLFLGGIILNSILGVAGNPRIKAERTLLRTEYSKPDTFRTGQEAGERACAPASSYRFGVEVHMRKEVTILGGRE